MKKRVFIRDDENYYRIFSFTQVPDGCIYCGWPNFGNTTWVGLERENNTFGPLITKSTGIEEKLSIHRSGRQHVGGNSEAGYTMIRWGHHLVNFGEETIGVRHLFTVCPTQPESVENYKRQDNHISLSLIGRLKSFAIVFFAVPGVKKMNISVIVKFHVDDMNTPPEISFGYFPLLHHNIVYCYYRTKNMEGWPTQAHVMYHDGFTVPLFIAKGGDPQTKDRQMQAEFRSPRYSHVIGEKQDELSILF